MESDVREKILETARCIFLKEGYKGTTINSIARPVGEKRRVWYKWQAAAFSGLTVSRTRLEAPKGLERI